MYVFAGVLLLALAVSKVVDLVMGFAALSRQSKTLVAMLVGIGTAWATDYSVFAGFGVVFRERRLNIVASGLALAGLAALWHEVLDLAAVYTRRVHDEATEIETRIPRAA